MFRMKSHLHRIDRFKATNENVNYNSMKKFLPIKDATILKAPIPKPSK